MKRSFSLPFTVAAIILAAALYEGAASRAQQKPATAQQKMASVDYLVGTWSCAHTVGTFSGKYTTAYSKVLGNLWLKQTYDFPSQQTAEGNEPAVTAETLMGYDERRQSWVRFFANSGGQYFAIRRRKLATAGHGNTSASSKPQNRKHPTPMRRSRKSRIPNT
jgi:hypothetical protein